jgi:prevent-host-death family protein
LQDAKSRFSELVGRVRSAGPQQVTVHGRDEVVVISAEEYRRLKGDLSGVSLVAAMQASPHRDIEIKVGRSAMPARKGRVLTGWLLDTNILSELRRAGRATSPTTLSRGRPRLDSLKYKSADQSGPAALMQQVDGNKKPAADLPAPAF